ncbi:hypothetical protein ZYGR_0I05010 [Zygosaccharomyces rouxii]|uniref:Zn(2)-C6 fungal-type domain-containing protein n=1 Tax=Zygosaccharomyces rouxii TaxID=4956 RepID=A0A1Q2ZXU3_ZYGRO|nr:hypothetical protein ZYGR_0I05010 [Zygosaccharomyces rouxii]
MSEEDNSWKFETYSCARCRKLKKRCPKESPVCNNCQRAGESCVYPGRAPRRTKRELEEAKLRGEFIPNKRSRGKDMGIVTAPNSNGAELGFTSSSTTTPTATSARIDNGFLSSPFPPTAIPPPPPPESTNSPVTNISKRPPPHAPVIQGKLEHELHKPDSTPIRASSIQIESISGIFKGGRTTPWTTAEGAYKPIERSLYDRFIAAYFTHNHKSFYMMDKVAFLNKVSTIRDFTAMDEEYEDSFIFQLYMAMAIGCTTLQRAQMLTKDEEGLSDHFAFLAMKKFCNVVHSQNIETIKCFLLLGIFALFEPKGVSSWTISGLTMRLVIGLGLHRALSPRRAQNTDPKEVEMRSRVFWSAYCFERLVATSLGRMSAIEDEEITTPIPRPLYPEEFDDLDVTNMMISLRRMSGRIYKKVHSASAGRKQYTMERRHAIISGLRNEIDEIYQEDKVKIVQKNDQLQLSGQDSISFHTSDTWLDMRHAQLQIMLYRPSALMPKPPSDNLVRLGECCLEALKHTYSLYKKKLLPLNWITLFRTLTICNSILYCLCHWNIDLVESKIEIQQCVDILQHFGEKWVFALRCADVFQVISNTILEISLSNGQVPNMEKLTRELFGASDQYQEVLEENEVGLLWNDNLS